MGDGRRPDEPLYIEGRWRAYADDPYHRAQLRATALTQACLLAAGGLTDAADDVVTEVTTVAERFEQWLTR